MSIKTMLSAAIAAVYMFPASALLAQGDVKINPIPVSDNIYMLSGQGGNIGLFLGEDGTFIIDDQFAPLTEKILAAIKSVGGDTPRFLINTHFHGDHTGGNENLGNAGTLIVSHDKVRERLVAGSYIKAFGMNSPPANKAALPVLTFSEDMHFYI
ncbi:MAG: MBL fold metallo-hydrolase, partial [Gammaproteobacteria bacterium]